MTRDMTGAGANVLFVAKLVTRGTAGATTARNALDAAQRGKMPTSGLAAGAKRVGTLAIKTMIGPRTVSDAPDVGQPGGVPMIGPRTAKSAGAVAIHAPTLTNGRETSAIGVETCGFLTFILSTLSD